MSPALETWLNNWIESNTVVEYAVATSTYSEGTGQFENHLRQYRVFEMVGDTERSNVFTTSKDCGGS